ncbi:MAG: glycoside hydrolase family 43 protein [Anaerolineae bacterium]|jgi:beta-xylosidase|nr:glycoside hydrolase family 43 protein [Anaerolineae bacterium]
MKNTPAALLLALIFLLAACSAPATDVAPATELPPATEVAPTAAPTSAPPAPTAAATATAAPTAAPTLAPGAFRNPIITDNFPDPFVLEADGVWYAYATNSSGKNVQLARSEDLLKWEMLPDAMPELAAWVKPTQPDVWAPEVREFASNFVLYYTARDKTSNRQCVGAATADEPGGAFRDASDKPLICQIEEGGTIDASPFQDDDKLYLLYKNDGNCCGKPTYIYSQELAPDGLSLVGEPQRLVSNDRPWEGSVIEAPTMLKRDDQYYLFYSANDYGGIKYAVGYALCESPLGPCEDAADNPLLESQMRKPPDMVLSPGHQTIIEVDGQHWIIYHGWEVINGAKGDRRLVYMNRLEWQDGRPVLPESLTEPQPAP